MNPEYKILEYNGKKYVYHYSLMTAIQSEYVREIAEFKHTQTEVKPTDMNELMRSGGINWRLLCARYLVREVVKDIVQPFILGKSETEVYNWLQTVPFDIFDDYINECLRDFFLNSKREYLTSILLQSKKSNMQISPLLMNFVKAFSEMKKETEG